MGKGPEWIFFQTRHADGQQAYEKMVNITNHQGNANQIHNQVSSTNGYQLSQWLSSKRQEIISVGKDVEKRECLCIVGGNVNWYNHYGK